MLIVETCQKATDGKHCWHPANWTHSVMNHADETCCWCGESRCVNLAPPPRDPGHGGYRP